MQIQNNFVLSEWILDTAIHKPHFFAILLGALIAALVAIVTVRKARQTARDKNSIDFETTYKKSQEIRNAWTHYKSQIKKMSKQDISNLFNNPDSQGFKACIVLLNEWERAGNGVYSRLYDGRFLYGVYGSAIVQLHEDLSPFIEEARKEKSKAFIQFTRMYCDWRMRQERECNKSYHQKLSEVVKKVEFASNHKHYKNISKEFSLIDPDNSWIKKALIKISWW